MEHDCYRKFLVGNTGSGDILYGVDIRTTSQHLYLMFDQQSSDMKKYLKQM